LKCGLLLINISTKALKGILDNLKDYKPSFPNIGMGYFGFGVGSAVERLTVAPSISGDVKVRATYVK